MQAMPSQISACKGTTSLRQLPQQHSSIARTTSGPCSQGCRGNRGCDDPGCGGAGLARQYPAQPAQNHGRPQPAACNWLIWSQSWGSRVSTETTMRVKRQRHEDVEIMSLALSSEASGRGMHTASRIPNLLTPGRVVGVYSVACAHAIRLSHTRRHHPSASCRCGASNPT